LQSYLLAYSTPNYELIDQTKYIESELIGKQIELKDLIYPEDIVLHFGNAKHTVLYPDLYPSSFYSLIFNLVKNRIFDGLRLANDFSLDWTAYRNEHEGVELRFGDGIPLNVLQSNGVMQIKGDQQTPIQPINRMFITSENNEEVRVFFFSDDISAVYEATTDINVKNVETFIGFGELLPAYHTNDGRLYLPDQPLSFIKFRHSYSQFTSEQMQKSLFVDPNNTKYFSERDGSRTEIYSDGKRALEIDKEQSWMVYSDPITTPGEDVNDLRANLFTAVKFINEHGGWNGNYMISSISENSETEGQTFLFRQYVESYPDISSKLANFGFIRIVLQHGIVTHYERSLINIDTIKTDINEVVLPGGEELAQLILSNGGSFNVETVFPAYRASITKDHVEFIPVWAMKLRDGTIDYLE
ncbi:MAG TPA: two-component system activity regulator YycH, partial [Bacilli bacterium]